MPVPPAFSIKSLGIAHVQGFEYGLQSFFCAWYSDEMDMVGHQAIGEYFQPVLLAIFLEPVEIGLSVFISIKNIFATIATLGNVVGHT